MLVVDDSVVIRRLVTEALSQDPQIEVVGTASHGGLAMQRIPQLAPDVITLDVEMPEMDGLETLRRLRRQYPKIRVIMLSSLTAQGAATTLDALALGASDYLPKLTGQASAGMSVAALRAGLAPKVKQFFSLEPVPREAFSAPLRSWAAARPRSAVVIGVSTGGPTALAEIIPQFPAGFSLPVLIVQHMPPMFTRLLAERLGAQTKLRVEEAATGSEVEPGKILIAPGNYHMRLQRTAQAIVTTLDQEPPENSCRPAVDVMFRSAAEIWGGGSVAVVLTGMGQDGLHGVETLKALGAYVIAQDEPSSVVWGMPGFVARAGLADAVLPLREVVPEILKQTGGEAKWRAR